MTAPTYTESDAHDAVAGFFAVANTLPPACRLIAYRLMRESIDGDVQAMRRALVEQQAMLDALMPETASKPAAATPTAAKYRNPENRDQVWSGIGRRPEWFLHAINAGVDPADMEIAG